MPTDAVQPETSSSYLGSFQPKLSARTHIENERTIQAKKNPSHPALPCDKMKPSPTGKNGAVDGQKAVLERLLEVLVLECLLLRNDLVQVLAGVDRDLVAAVAVVDAEEGYAHVGGGGLGLLVALERLQVEDGGVGVLHAYPPALHGADTKCDAVILTLVRVL